jgi:TM2 domain-containing membrane protein YozV
LRPVKKHRLAFRKDFYMQRAVSAGLLSALVFPGAGHLYLKRPRRACLFLLPALVALFVLAGDIVQRASALADQVLAGTLAPDPAAIAARLQAQGGTSTLDTICSAVLVACWLGSIIDSIVVARAPAPGLVQPERRMP